MLDEDITKKVATIRKGLGTDSSDDMQAAANELFLIELELRAARTFYRSIKAGIENLGKSVI